MAKQRNRRRIAYGIRCTWWGDADKAGTGRLGTPGCPYCGQLVMETTTGLWNLAKDQGQDFDFYCWLENKCFSAKDSRGHLSLEEGYKKAYKAYTTSVKEGSE